MDFASGGSLSAYVQQRQRLKEPLARWFFQQVVLAFDYCHRKVCGAERAGKPREWG
jgi:serine/threonine-protein kinase SRK2